jgi:hypothetical protein
MTSGGLDSRSRSPMCELDLYLVVRYLHTKLEHRSLIISEDNERKPSVMWHGRTVGRTNCISISLYTLRVAGDKNVCTMIWLRENFNF